jgi:transglutaminase-like putative cysteine protease
MQSNLGRKLGIPPTSLQSIPSGRAGTRATLRAMKRLVDYSRADYELIRFARQLVHYLPEKAWEAQARAIFYFVRDRIRYVLDPVGIETISSPDETLKVRHGDCDDKSVLAASLLLAIGHPARFLAVAFDGGPFSHVLVETPIGTEWWPMELTDRSMPFGEMPEPDRITDKMTETLGNN